MLETQFDPETGLLTVTAHGEITHEDYTKRLIPAVDAAVATVGPISLLYVFAEDFGGYSARAMWDDTRLGLTHLRDFRRIAVAADAAAIRDAVAVFGVLIPAEVRSFPLADADAAGAWCIGAG